MNNSDPIPLMKALLPRVPLIGKTAVSHMLGISPTASQWDLKTSLTINVLRSFIISPSPDPVSKAQLVSCKDPGIKGRMWISKVTMPPPPEDSLRQTLFRLIEDMKQPGEAPGGFGEPELRPVEAEWTGYRAGATKTSPELRIEEPQKYAELMKEATNPTTILYFHGGAYYLLDPASHRLTTVKLAKLTSGRCFSVRYRLAPQNPFPAALLDALVAYLSLLHPPPRAIHAPVSPSHIVLAGDSAGGNLCFALLQTLLELRRQNLPVSWHGVELSSIPLPAGLACNSPWMDITHSSPSCDANALYDYLPARAITPRGGITFPPDAIWPASPPRVNLYAPDALLCHPLVSPLAASPASWTGSPPVFIVTGQELLADEDKHVAATLARQGVPVVYNEFEAMPHCFALVLEGFKGSYTCFEEWAGFCRDVSGGKQKVEEGKEEEEPVQVRTKGTKFIPKTLERVDVDVTALSPWSQEEVVARMRAWVREIEEKHPDTLAKL